MSCALYACAVLLLQQQVQSRHAQKSLSCVLLTALLVLLTFARCVHRTILPRQIDSGGHDWRR